MHTTDIAEYALRLKNARGEDAVLVAAQRARLCAQQGKEEEAATWKRVEAALMVLRPPRET
ncbi:MAG: hypothetical protein HXY22_07155 [Alphaproteobacteria bacterium]|nr:hypothetical protein [Alphaproteobacteria bacterium]